MSGALIAVQDLLETGGAVLYPLMAVTFAMWTLILERLYYFWRQHPARAAEVVARWRAREDRDSWHARQIRRQWISELSLDLHRSLGLVRTLVALCPLLGLLGTVTGMIDVFEIMAVTGSGNPRAMAEGVMRATVPTMAGMVAAISGLYPSLSLPRLADDEIERIDDAL